MAEEAADGTGCREEDEQVNPWLEAFLDAEGYEKQLEALSRMRGKISQKELDSLYLILDIQPGTGDPDSQLAVLSKIWRPGSAMTAAGFDERRQRDGG